MLRNEKSMRLFKVRKCKVCDKEIKVTSTLQNKCFFCAIKTHKKISAGKKTKQWKNFRSKYLKDKKNHEGYFVTKLGEWVKNPDLDHIKKRSTNPELVFDKDNIELMTPERHRLEKHK